MDHRTHDTIEYALGSVANRNTCCTLSEFPAIIQTAITGGSSLFRSYYTYPNGLGDHLRLYRTIKGYDGPVRLDRIVIDLDRGTLSADNALHRLRAYLERLRNETPITEEHYQVYFSGTGYHVEFANIFNFPEGQDLPRLVKDTLTHVFPEGDNIYDRARLLRVANTINEKSRLYKIPLLDTEIWGGTAAQIMELAKAPRLDFPVKQLEAEFIMEDQQRKVLPVEPPKFKKVVDDSTNFVTCTQEMYLEGPVEGTRHQKILRIASSRRRGGSPYDAVVRDMQAWSPALGKEEVERLVRSVYSTPLQYGCQDSLMKKYCSAKCMYYKYKNYGGAIATAENMEAEFTQFIQQDVSNTSFNIQEIFSGVQIPYRFLPGEMVIVFGDTKVGKTAFIQNVVVKLRRMKTLYISLEVHQNLIYRRFIQIAHQMSKEQVEEHYRNGGASLAEPIRHIQCISTPSTVGEMFTNVKSLEPQIVVVDTTDGIKTRYRNDPIAASNEIALELRELASATNTIVIGIHHISKNSLIDFKTGQKKPLTTHSGKYSSTLEQKADKVIGIELHTDNVTRIVRSLAARDEGEFNMHCFMNPHTFTFQEIP